MGKNLTRLQKSRHEQAVEAKHWVACESSTPTKRPHTGLTGRSHRQGVQDDFQHRAREKCARLFTLYDIANTLALPMMREVFEPEDEDMSDARHQLLIQLNSMISQMDDRQLKLLLKLAQVLLEDSPD